MANRDHSERLNELLLYLWYADPYAGLAVLDLPEPLQEDWLLTLCEGDGLIQFGRRNHIHVGGGLHRRLVLEPGYEFVSISNPRNKPMRAFLHEVKNETVEEPIRYRVRLTHKGSTEAARQIADAASIPPPSVAEIRERCLLLQAKLETDSPRISIAIDLTDVVWPAMRRWGNAPAKPECLDKASREGFVAALRGDNEWTERCVDGAIGAALIWCKEHADETSPLVRDKSIAHLGVTGQLIKLAIESARAAWHEGYNVVVSTINSNLDSKLPRLIRGEGARFVPLLLSCRHRLGKALQDIPLGISGIPNCRSDNWQPWCVGFVNDVNSPPSYVGVNYSGVLGDDLSVVIQVLESRPADWPWMANLIEPIEHDVVKWDRLCDNMVKRLEMVAQTETTPASVAPSGTKARKSIPKRKRGRNPINKALDDAVKEAWESKEFKDRHDIAKRCEKVRKLLKAEMDPHRALRLSMSRIRRNRSQRPMS